MTDKQIIIDNVDVSGCEWFYKNDACKNTCKYFLTHCESVAIQNCMYKYAKRKEQECEMLKKQHQCDKGLITSTGKMNYQLLQEYDKNRTYIQQVQAENGYFRNKSEKSEDLIKKIIDFVQKEIEYFNHDEEYQCDWKELLKIIESEGYDVRRKKESKRKIIKGSPRG